MNVGFIGLGIMGLPMALNIMEKKGICIWGYDTNLERAALFQEKGGIYKEKSEIYKNCRIIFMCLPTNKIVDETLGEIINQCKEGTIVSDMGSTSPEVIQRRFEQGGKKGISIMDSPVSGGEEGAVKGTLAIMCGGDKDTFDELYSYFECMGSSAVYMGKSGFGSIAKLANNIIVGVYLGAFSEAFAFAAKAGLDPQVLYNAIKGGYAGSMLMDAKIPKVINRDFSPGARIAVHQKDLLNAVDLAEQMEVKIPFSQKMLDIFSEIEKEGMINDDQCAVARIYERDMGIEIR